MGRTITQRRRFAAFVYGVMSLCLFGEAAELIQQEYRIAMNPRGIGRIERIWTDIRGRGHQRVHIADFAFTVMHAGNPIICHAKSIDIGSADVDTKVGDTIELSPIPDSCQTPYVINMQPRTWIIWIAITAVIGAGFMLALVVWGTLSNAKSRLNRLPDVNP